MMYCPNCAKETSGRERFCRSCGLKLEFISRIAKAEVNALQKGSSRTEIVPETTRRPIAMAGFVVMMAGTLAAFLGADVFLLRPVTTIGVIMAILGISLIGYQSISGTRTPLRMVAGPDTTPLDEDDAPSSIRELSGSGPSVTERTTAHLDVGPESPDANSASIAPSAVRRA